MVSDTEENVEVLENMEEDISKAAFPARRVFMPINSLSGSLVSLAPRGQKLQTHSQGFRRGNCPQNSQERGHKAWSSDIEVIYRPVVLVSSMQLLQLLVSAHFPGPQKRPFMYKHL